MRVSRLALPLVLASACRSPEGHAPPTTSASSHTAPAPPSSAPTVAATSSSSPSACRDVPVKRTRAAAFNAAGKIDRAARVLRAAAEACPERAPEVWEPLLATLAELGRVEEVQTLAAGVRARADAPPAAPEAAARALEKVAPLAAAPPDLPAARQTARRLFSQAMLEPNREKARDGFLRAAEALPPGGPSLYQAARFEARGGDATAAQRLFDRALTAIERATRQAPAIATRSAWHGLSRIDTAASGRLLMAALDTDLLVLDAIGWRPRFEYDRRASAAAVSADGSLVIAAMGRRLLSCSLVEAACTSADVAGEVRELAISADGDTLAARGEDGGVTLLDGATLATRAGLPRDRGKAAALVMAAAGDRLWVGLEDGSVLRARTADGTVEGAHRGHGAGIVALALDPRGRAWLAADERSIRRGALTGSAEGEVFAEAVGTENDPIQKLVPTADGATLFVVRKTSLDAFDLATRAPRAANLPAASSMGFDVAAAPGRLYVAAKQLSTMPWLTISTNLDAFTLAEAVKRDDAKPLPGSTSWGGSPAPFTYLLTAGGSLAIVDDQCGIEAWDVGRGAYLRASNKLGVFRNCRRPRLSPDGRTVLGTPDHVKVGALDLAGGGMSLTGAGAETLDAPDPAAPKGAVEVAWSEHAVVWVDAQGGVHAGPRDGPQRDLGKVHRPADVDGVRDPAPPPAISPDGAMVAFRAGADVAEIWSVADARRVHRVRRSRISGLAFGATGTLFVAALDGTLTLVRGEAEQTTQIPGGDPVFSLVAIRGGKAIAGAVDTGVVHVWSAEGGALLATMRSAGLGAMAITRGGVELFGKAEEALDCRFGPFVFGLDLCRERLVTGGALAAALSEERTEP